MDNKVKVSVGKVMIKSKVSTNHKLLPANEVKAIYGDFTNYINRKNNLKPVYRRRG